MLDRIPQVLTIRKTRLRNTSFVETPHASPVNVHLINGLPRSAIPQLGRPVRRHDQQRNLPMMRFDDGRMVVCNCSPGCADQHHGCTLPLRNPKRTKRSRTFIQHDVLAQVRMPRNRHCQGSGARSGRYDDVTHPACLNHVGKNPAGIGVRIVFASTLTHVRNPSASTLPGAFSAPASTPETTLAAP